MNPLPTSNQGVLKRQIKNKKEAENGPSLVLKKEAENGPSLTINTHPNTSAIILYLTTSRSNSLS